MAGMRPPRASPQAKLGATNVIVFMPQTTKKKLQIPSSKLQRSTKLQAQKPTCASFARLLFLGFGFELWNLSGAWGLVLGVSLSGGSAEMRLGL